MLAPTWALRDLASIDRSYFAWWNEKRSRWEVREWVKRAKTTSENVRRYSRLVLTVAEYEDGVDTGFKPLDQRALHAVRVGRWNGEHPRELLEEIDRHNERVQAEADGLTKDVARQVGGDIYRKFRYPQMSMRG